MTIKTKVDMKNDGHDHERFRDLLKTVARVPKEAIKKREDEQKKKAKKS